MQLFRYHVECDSGAVEHEVLFDKIYLECYLNLLVRRMVYTVCERSTESLPKLKALFDRILHLEETKWPWVTILLKLSLSRSEGDQGFGSDDRCQCLKRDSYSTPLISTTWLL
jgi:hypothetical protein